jgi:phage-related protein
MNEALFLGDSKAVISAFPRNVRRTVGFQIELVQAGLEPEDWKPMSTVGAGVREIRVQDRAAAFRVIYVATFREAVYILHAFQKKAQTTPKHEIELAAKRFRELARVPR